jgi:hypothetical protein
MSPLIRLAFFLTAGLTLACNPARQQAKAIQIEFGTKPTVVYKTKKDYSKYVPILLSEDKTAVAAYPAPTDIYYKGQLAYPTALDNGYWLDNRGINKQVAFLDITYEEYATLAAAPSKQTLMERIHDSDPLLACYDCGNLTDIDKLNILIAGKALDKCKDLLQ